MGTTAGPEISCTIRMDDKLRAVYYNGQDITSSVVGALDNWKADKKISFTSAPGAYLSVSGDDTQGDFGKSGGFWGECPGYIPASSLGTAWTSSCGNSEPDAIRKKGLGSGWQTPKLNPAERWENKPKGDIGETGKKYCTFRAIPLEQSCTSTTYTSQCYGLVSNPATSWQACQKTCCEDESCQVWQWLKNKCWMGKPSRGCFGASIASYGGKKKLSWFERFVQPLPSQF